LQRRLTLYTAVAVLIIAGLLPLVAILAKSFLLDGTVTLSVYRKLFSDPTRYLSSFSHTISVAAATTAIALVAGVTLGVLLVKTDMPLRRMFAMLLSLPLLMPPYIIALSWSDLLARDGLVAMAIPDRFVTALSANLYGLSGCVWVMATALMPIVMILTMIALRAINPRLEEAARLVADWPRTLRHISLPIVVPAVVLAALIVFLLAAGEVAVPMLLRYPVYPVETLVQFAAFYDFGAAAASAVPLLTLAVIMVNLERCYLQEKTHPLLARTPSKRALVVPLHGWRIPASVVVGVIGTLLVLLPMVALVQASLTPFGYGEAWRRTTDSLVSSVEYACAGATLLTAVGFLCAYLIARRSLRWWSAVDQLALLLFTVPGAVIGIGMIALWNRPATAVLYSSGAMIIFGYLAQYSALTTRIIVATLATIPTALEDAAQVVGAPWLARLGCVVLPAAMPGIVAAWILAFIFCLRDTGASMLVYPAGGDPLPVRIFALMANGAPGLISAACVILIAINLSMLGLLFALLHAFGPRE
jgi:iron(III) transport system permease protein